MTADPTVVQTLLARAGQDRAMGPDIGTGAMRMDTRFESTFQIVRNFAVNQYVPNIFGNSDTVEAVVLRSEPDPSTSPATGGALMGAGLIARCRVTSGQHTTLLPDPETLNPTDARSQALISAFPAFRYSAPGIMGMIPPGTVVSVTFDPGSLQGGVLNLPMAPPCVTCPSGSVGFPGSMGAFAPGYAGPTRGAPARGSMKGIDVGTHKLYTTLLPNTPAPAAGQRVVGTDLNGLTAVVAAELAFWGGRNEGDPGVFARLKMYWDHLNYGSWSPTGTAWSAAYISYVLNRVDPQFPKSSAHYYYASSAKKKKGNWSLFATRTSGQIKAQIGDVLVKARSGRPTNTHGDVVYKIVDGKAWLSGGNLKDTAKGNITLALDSSQNYATYGSYEVILKKNGQIVAAGVT